MPDIKDSVGNAKGQVQDIAMVQMMLKVIKDAKGDPYLKVNYSGEWNDQTKDAIIRFQKDHKLLDPPAAAAKAGAPPPPAEKEGIVDPKSATFKELNGALPVDYKDAIILPGAKTVYFPGSSADAKASSAKLKGELQLDMKFRVKAADFIDQFYNQTKIVLSTPAKTGMRRDFQGQMNVISNAGPGESNHQFGQAADIGFGGLKWVDGDGTFKTDTSWLDLGADTAAKKAYMTPAKAAEFFKAHHDLAFGAKVGLSPTGLAGDDTHVQAYSDNSLSYSKSLTTLLNIDGEMKWEGAKHVKNQQNKYKSDFGLAGKTYEIGTAKQIFGGNATISKPDLVEALKASAKDLSKMVAFKDFTFVKNAVKALKPVPGKLPPPITGASVAEKDITGADLQLLQKAAKQDWSKADQNWKQWVPVK